MLLFSNNFITNRTEFRPAFNRARKMTIHHQTGSEKIHAQHSPFKKKVQIASRNLILYNWILLRRLRGHECLLLRDVSMEVSTREEIGGVATIKNNLKSYRIVDIFC